MCPELCFPSDDEQWRDYFETICNRIKKDFQATTKPKENNEINDKNDVGAGGMGMYSWNFLKLG